MPGADDGRKQQVKRFAFAFAGHAAGGKDGPDQQIEEEHVRDVDRRVFRPDVKTNRHDRDRQDHADLDHDPQHQRALTEDLAADFLVVHRIRAVLHQVVAFRGREQPVRELVAIDHETDRFLGFLFQVDHFLAFAADVRRMQQPLSRVHEQQKANRGRDRGQQRHGQHQPQPCLAIGEREPDRHAKDRQGQNH